MGSTSRSVFPPLASHVKGQEGKSLPPSPSKPSQPIFATNTPSHEQPGNLSLEQVQVGYKRSSKVNKTPPAKYSSHGQRLHAQRLERSVSPPLASHVNRLSNGQIFTITLEQPVAPQNQRDTSPRKDHTQRKENQSNGGSKGI
ncbi:MAG: hypothetical protein IPP74_04050 [Alphaproteobacteria bacterium]|nr:hypothetical protein [Alphaproteobacteria bacterium]